jgi:hypothetical protein
MMSILRIRLFIQEVVPSADKCKKRHPFSTIVEFNSAGGVGLLLLADHQSGPWSVVVWKTRRLALEDDDIALVHCERMHGPDVRNESTPARVHRSIKGPRWDNNRVRQTVLAIRNTTRDCILLNATYLFRSNHAGINEGAICKHQFLISFSVFDTSRITGSHVR